MAPRITPPPLSPAQWAIVGAGLVTFLASFLPFVNITDPELQAVVGSDGANAWEDGLFPTYTWPALFGLAMAAAVLVDELTEIDVPRRVAGIPLPKLFLVVSAFGVLLMFSFMITAFDFGIGLWLSLPASIALMVGAVLHDYRTGAGAPPAPSA